MGWPLTGVVSHSGWSLTWVVSHGPVSDWGGFSLGQSLIQVESDTGGLSPVGVAPHRVRGLSFRLVFYWSGLSMGWLPVGGGSHWSGLSLGWHFIGVVSLWGGLLLGWSLIEGGV